jgi:drug/metabolite transporter (DMT)-like permease
MKRESFAIGVTFTILSALGVALVGLLGKLGGQDWSLEALIFWRYVAASVMCTLVLWFFKKLQHVFSSGSMKLHLLRASFVLIAQYSFYYYIQTNPLLNGLVLLSLGPLFIPLIGWLVNREEIGKSTWIGLAVSFLGMLLVLQPDSRIFSFVSLIGVLSGISQGCSQIVFAMSSRGEKPEQSILNMLLLCAGFSLIPYLIGKAPHTTNTFYAPVAIALILGMAAATMLNQFARVTAYKHATPSRLSTFMYFSILLGGIFDWLIFDEAPNTLSIIGALLVIIGGVLKIFFRWHFLRKK